MNLSQLGTWAAQNKPAVLGVGAAGAVGLGLLARRKSGGDVTAPAIPQHSSFSAGGQVDAATGAAGSYNSTATDLYSALSPELAGIGNTLGVIQEALNKTPPTPVPAPPASAVASTLFRPGMTGNYVTDTRTGLIAEVQSDGSLYGLTPVEWSAVNAKGPVPLNRIGHIGNAYSAEANLRAADARLNPATK